MSLQVEKMEKNMAKLTIEVSAEDLDKAMEKAYQKQKSKITLPGFRKGKAPRKMIERMYGKGVFMEDAVNALVPEHYSKALEECDLEIVSQPEFSVTQMEPGKALIFTADVATKPEVTLGEYKGVEVPKADIAVTDEEVDAEVKKEQEKNSRTITVEDRAAAKDAPELDVDFANDVAEIDSLAEYRENVKKTLTEKKEKEAETAKETAAIKKAIENAQMDIPELMIQTQCRQMMDDFGRRMQSQGLSMEQYFQFTGMTADKMMEDMKPQALKRIQTRLVLEKIAEVEDIQITEEETDAEIAKMAEAYKMEADKIKEILGDEQLEQLKKDLAVQKAVTVVAEAAKEV